MSRAVTAAAHAGTQPILPLDGAGSVPAPRLDVGLYEGVSHAAYHADPAIEPSLSASIANVLLKRSPLHAHHQHPRLGAAGGDRSSDAMDRGSIIHGLLLGGGAGFCAVEADDWRTKAAREARDGARINGLVPVLARVLDACNEVVARLQPRLPALQATELTAIWRSEGGVLCRCRIDGWDGSTVTILDLKTGEDARRSSEPRNVVSNGLQVPVAAYTEAMETLLPACAGRVRFRWLFAETAEPFDVIEAEPAGTLVELGRRQWLRAVRTWGECLATDYWPGFAPLPLRIDAPEWALAADLEQQGRTMGSNSLEDI